MAPHQTGSIMLDEREYHWQVVKLPGNWLATVEAPDWPQPLEAFFDASAEPEEGERQRRITAEMLEYVIRGALAMGWCQGQYGDADSQTPLRLNGDAFLPRRLRN